MSFHQDEVSLKEIRKHWFIAVTMLWYFPVLAVLPALAMIVVPLFAEIPVAMTTEVLLYILFGYSLWLLVLWVVAFVRWTDYYLDVWIVTPERIIDIDQKGMFNREVSSLRFERIQDITADVSGLLPTLLDFGALHVQSAAEQREFILDGAGSPVENKEFLQKQLEKVTEEPARVTLASDGDSHEGLRSPDDPGELGSSESVPASADQ